MMFNIRVYGIMTSDKNEVLLCDEIRFGKKITKFPGGGLEYGEGLRDALVREWKEETGQEIKTGDHIYTTDFFQPSLFHKKQQVICVYYKVIPLSPLRAEIKFAPFDFKEEIEDAQIFRWVPVQDLEPDMMTLPIDKVVVGEYI